MPAYNFQDRFASLVASGRKLHTIRPRRKACTWTGDPLFLYTGMRTKKCRLLLKTSCKKVTPILICSVPLFEGVILDGIRMPANEVEQLAKRDGFFMAADFYTFFRETYGHLFDGELIEWNPAQ